MKRGTRVRVEYEAVTRYESSGIKDYVSVVTDDGHLYSPRLRDLTVIEPPKPKFVAGAVYRNECNGLLYVRGDNTWTVVFTSGNTAGPHPADAYTDSERRGDFKLIAE